MKVILLILTTLIQFQAFAQGAYSNRKNVEVSQTVSHVDQLDQLGLDYLPPNTILQFMNPLVAEIKSGAATLVCGGNTTGYGSDQVCCYAIFAPDADKRRESREGLTFQISSVVKDEGKKKYIISGTGFPAAVTAIECVYDRYASAIQIGKFREILRTGNAKFTLAPISQF